MMKNKYCTQQGLLRKIQKDENIDFVAFVYSAWHVISVMAAIGLKRSARAQMKGIMCVAYGSNAGGLLDTAFYDAALENGIEVLLYKNVDVVDNKTVKCYFKDKANRKGKEFYVLNPYAPNYNMIGAISERLTGYKVKSLVVDEGLATYMRSRMSWVSYWTAEKKYGAEWLRVYWQKGVVEPYFDDMMERVQLYEREYLLSKNCDGSWVANTKMIPYYRRAITEIAERIGIEPSISYKDAVIICTQPYAEQGLISSDEDIRVLQKICAKLEAKQRRVILKLHPGERDLDRYKGIKCIVDRSSEFPLEVLLAAQGNQPRCMIGYTTTTLLTGRLLFGIPTISLIDRLDKKKIEKGLWRELMAFKRIFGRFIKF